MQSLSDHTVVVAGGTGNVGPFVVRALLERQATVVVPSRSEEKLGGLREYLSRHVGTTGLGRLRTFVGNLSDETEAQASSSESPRRRGRPAPWWRRWATSLQPPRFLTRARTTCSRRSTPTSAQTSWSRAPFCRPSRNPRGPTYSSRGPSRSSCIRSPALT